MLGRGRECLCIWGMCTCEEVCKGACEWCVCVCGMSVNMGVNCEVCCCLCGRWCVNVSVYVNLCEGVWGYICAHLWVCVRVGGMT